MRVLSHEPPRHQRECAHAGPEPCSGSGERLETGRARQAILHLDFEKPLCGVDGLDGAREHHAPAVEEPRPDDERRRAAACGVHHDITNDTDAGAVRADDKPLGIREPVLEHVAASSEDVHTHTACLPQPPQDPNL